MSRRWSKLSSRYSRLSSEQNNEGSVEKKDDKKLISCILGSIIIFLVIMFAIRHNKSSNKGTIQITSIDQIDELHDRARNNINIKTNKININNDKIYYREATPINSYNVDKKAQILLLHGKKYTSNTWKGLGTLQLLADRGYRSIAVDLPGFGLSKKATNIPKLTSKYEMNNYMNDIVNQLNMKNVVIISPSFSGYYSIPYLMESSKLNDNIIGFVSLAAVRSNIYTKKEYSHLNNNIAVGIFSGEYDKTQWAQDSKLWLSYTPNNVNIMINKAEHPAFVGNIKEFHKELLYFLNSYCKLNLNEENYDFDLDDNHDSNDQLFEDWNNNKYDYSNDIDEQDYIQNNDNDNHDDNNNDDNNDDDSDDDNDNQDDNVDTEINENDEEYWDLFDGEYDTSSSDQDYTQFENEIDQDLYWSTESQDQDQDQDQDKK